MSKKILLLIFALALFLGAVILARLFEKEPTVEIPGGTVQERDAHLKNELKKIQEKFPAGSKVENLVYKLKAEGYLSDNSPCTEESIKKIEDKGGCITINKVYGSRKNFIQYYDVLYDKNDEIESIQMGRTHQWKD